MSVCNIIQIQLGSEELWPRHGFPVYCIQGKFRPHFIFALFQEGEFKTGLIELNIKDYIRKLKSGPIQDWANQLQISKGPK